MKRVRLVPAIPTVLPATGYADIFIDPATGQPRVSRPDGSVVQATPRDILWYREIGASGYAQQYYIAGQTSGGAFSDWGPAPRGYIYEVPHASGRGGRIDRIGIQVQTAGTAGAGTGKARLGIYRAVSDLELAPGALVLDAGQVDVTTTGQKIITIDQALDPDTLYYFAFWHDCATTGPVLAGVPWYCQAPVWGTGFWDFRDSTHTHVVGVGTYGPLPDPAISFGYGGPNGGAVPVIAMRYSA